MKKKYYNVEIRWDGDSKQRWTLHYSRLSSLSVARKWAKSIESPAILEKRIVRVFEEVVG